jgi:hypothetical protein
MSEAAMESHPGRVSIDTDAVMYQIKVRLWETKMRNELCKPSHTI